MVSVASLFAQVLSLISRRDFSKAVPIHIPSAMGRRQNTSAGVR